MQRREREREVREGPKGEFLIAMSNKENEVVKFISEEQRILCEKIITLHPQRDQQLILHYEAQLQTIRDYLQRFHGFPSAISTHEHMQIYRTFSQSRLVLKIVTRFWEYPTFQDFLRKQAIRGEQINRNGRVIIHFLTEFFQLLLQAGGIDRYFYTPKNIFLIQPQAGERLKPMGRLVLNITSLAGLKLLVGNSRIIREDYCEIYPLLPPDFITLQGDLMGKTGNQDESCRRRKERELDMIIRKRALGWLIICFILRKVPQLQESRNMPPLIDETTIKKTLDESVRLFDKVLTLAPFKKLFEDAIQQTGIDFVGLLRLIFVIPYQTENRPKDFRFISWEDIYQRLFTQNKFAQKQEKSEQETEAFFRRMLQTMWGMEPHKQYYLERDFANDRPEQPQSFVYFLVKMNCNFHKLLRYRNVCQLLLKQKFSEDSTQIVIKLINIFSEKNQEGKNDEEEGTPHSKNEEITHQDESLYNPFVPKSRKQVSLLQEISNQTPQVQGFMGKLSRMPEILQSVSSLEFFQSSGKDIVSVSGRQTILTQFCESLWPL